MICITNTTHSYRNYSLDQDNIYCKPKEPFDQALQSEMVCTNYNSVNIIFTAILLYLGS